MKRKSKQIALIVVMAVVAIGLFIGTQTYTMFARIENDALEDCHAYLEKETGEEIDLADLETSGIETVFPKPFDKRFRTTCTYGDVTVEFESKPLRPWRVVNTSGLD